MRVQSAIVSIIILLCPASALALVNINTATFEELDTLPGVGEATANKIISSRNTNGAFSNISTVCSLVGANGVGVDTATCKNIEAAIHFGQVPGTDQASSNTATTHSDGNGTVIAKDKKVVNPVTGLIMNAPDIAHVNGLIEFSAEPSDGRKDRLVRYRWNFGDGTTTDTASPTHSYKYPGTYVVIVESYYLKEEKIARHEIEVLPVQISIAVAGNNIVIIYNNSNTEIDLSGMKVVGTEEFVFPRYSILLPGKALTVNVVGQSFVLLDVLGKVVATTLVNKVTVNDVVSAGINTAKPTAKITPVAVSDKKAEEEIVINSVDYESEGGTSSSYVALTSKANIPAEAWPYLGLFGIISLGLLVIYGKSFYS